MGVCYLVLNSYLKNRLLKGDFKTDGDKNVSFEFKKKKHVWKKGKDKGQQNFLLQRERKQKLTFGK